MKKWINISYKIFIYISEDKSFSIELKLEFWIEKLIFNINFSKKKFGKKNLFLNFINVLIQNN